MKKHRMFGMAVMLAMLQSTVSFPAAAETVQYLRGDLNFDGKINACDLTLMKRGLMIGFEPLAARIADVNADGTADRNDAEMLRDYLLTKIDSFPEQYYIEPETPQIQPLFGSRQMEYLSRGVSAVSSGKSVFVSWRLLADDPAEIPRMSQIFILRSVDRYSKRRSSYCTWKGRSGASAFSAECFLLPAASSSARSSCIRP